MLEAAQLELFRDSLLSGRYNLLLGSGTSLTSRNKSGQLLRSAERLREELCALTGLRAGTSLTRAYGLLTDDQRRSEIVETFSGCKPGPDLNRCRGTSGNDFSRSTLTTLSRTSIRSLLNSTLSL